MADKYSDRPSSDPAIGARSITPSDSADYLSDAGGIVYRALYVGTAGDVKIMTLEGETVTFSSFSGILPIRVRRVYNTDTTASDIVGMY